MNEIAKKLIAGEFGEITEDVAMDIHHALANEFGWAGTFFTRADAETSWQCLTPLSPGEEAAEMPDEVWDAVCSTWEWRKGLTDVLTERGWSLVEEAVTEAIGDEAA